MRKINHFPIEDKQALQKDEDLYFDLDSVASTTECTGLIPTPPESEAQAESYTDIYAIPRPDKPAIKKKNKKNRK